MNLPCEIVVKSVAPSIRALLALQLIETYKMTQVKTADVLGVTQTAVSRYQSRERGRFRKIENEAEVRRVITTMAASIAEGRLERTGLMAQFCSICNLVRGKGLMCELCKQNDPSLDIEKCKCTFPNVCEL